MPGRSPLYSPVHCHVSLVEITGRVTGWGGAWATGAAAISSACGAVWFKFKQHRDSPTQVPIGTPFAMLGVAVALIYMPSLLTEAGSSAFEEGDIQGAEGSYSNLGGE